MFKISKKVHQKNDKNRFCAAQASQRGNESVIDWGISFMFCVLFHVLCTFRSNHQVLCLSFSRFSNFSCINLYFIVHFKVKCRIDFESLKLRRQNRTPYWLLSTNGLNTNSNEASWASQWEAAQVLLHV